MELDLNYRFTMVCASLTFPSKHASHIPVTVTSSSVSKILSCFAVHSENEWDYDFVKFICKSIK